MEKLPLQSPLPLPPPVLPPTRPWKCLLEVFLVSHLLHGPVSGCPFPSLSWSGCSCKTAAPKRGAVCGYTHQPIPATPVTSSYQTEEKELGWKVKVFICVGRWISFWYCPLLREKSSDSYGCPLLNLGVGDGITESPFLCLRMWIVGSNLDSNPSSATKWDSGKVTTLQNLLSAIWDI